MHFSPGSSIFAPIALLLWHSAAAAPAPSAMMPTSGDLTVYVNPFIGTEGPVAQGALNSGASSGDTFPGVGLPFGVVKLGPDTNEPDQTTNPFAGYTPNGNVTAFTCFHECGVGGASKYGVVGHMPLTTLDGINVLDNATYMQPRVTHDSSSVGYYKSVLANGVTAELTASRHAGFIQYTYPSIGDRVILVDVSHNLPSGMDAEFVKSQTYSNGQLVVRNGGARYEGWGVWRGGWGGGGVSWGEGSDYKIYFCNYFDSTPESYQYFSGPWNDPTAPPSPSTQATFSQGFGIQGGPEGDDQANRIGAVFTFGSNTAQVKSRLGVSFISVDKACNFAGTEMPSWTLNDTVNAAVKEWNEDVLSKITTTETSNTTRLTMFYSALYRAHQMPSDRTGENPDWNSTEPYYDDFYTLWDTFRCLNSFYLLVQPSRAMDMVRALIDIWRHVGFMPDARSGNFNGKVQGGSNSDNVLADAYVKGMRGAINWTDGYKAMKTNAEVTPPPNHDPDDPTCANAEGRCGLPDWIEYSYVTPNFSSSVSRTVEYSLNDFSLSQVAKDLALQDYEKYLHRSANWKNLWNNDISQYNVSGFIGPRAANGSFINVSPQDLDYTTEGLIWEYTWTIPFDLESLFTLMGGAAKVEERLDTMFIPGLRTANLGVGVASGTTLFNPGNEPSFFTPFIYNYLPGRQYKSVARSRQNININYFATSAGLPGNSDAGAVDSWMVWQMLGLYPVVTQPVYLILSPWFSDITVNIGDKPLHITAKGLSDNSFYVQSLKVNGKAWRKSWLSHDDIASGGRLEFVLGPNSTIWDTGDVPPSPGHF